MSFKLEQMNQQVHFTAKRIKEILTDGDEVEVIGRVRGDGTVAPKRITNLATRATLTKPFPLPPWWAFWHGFPIVLVGLIFIFMLGEVRTQMSLLRHADVGPIMPVPRLPFSSAPEKQTGERPLGEGRNDHLALYRNDAFEQIIKSRLDDVRRQRSLLRHPDVGPITPARPPA